MVCGASRIDAAASCRCMFGGSLGSIPRVRCGPNMRRRAILSPRKPPRLHEHPCPSEKFDCTLLNLTLPPIFVSARRNNIRCRVWSVHVVLHNVSGIGGSKDPLALLFSHLSSFSSSCRDSRQVGVCSCTPVPPHNSVKRPPRKKDCAYPPHPVSALSHSLPVPVSVKLRLCQDASTTPLLGARLEAAGASWLTLHARHVSARRRRAGAADLAQVKALKDAVKIPVVSNGNVRKTADVASNVEETGADGVMVGEALLANPWYVRMHMGGLEVVLTEVRVASSRTSCPTLSPYRSNTWTCAASTPARRRCRPSRHMSGTLSSTSGASCAAPPLPPRLLLLRLRRRLDNLSFNVLAVFNISLGGLRWRRRRWGQRLGRIQ